MPQASARVLFPVHVVEQAIANARRSPSTIRDGNPHADLGGDRVHFVPGSSKLLASSIIAAAWRGDEFADL